MAFVNLNKKIDNYRGSRSPRRLSRSTLYKILGALVVLIVVTYLPARGIYSSAQQLQQAGRELNAALNQNNFDGVKRGVAQAKDSADSLNGWMNWLFWLRAVPFVGGYYSDAKHFSQAATYELEAAEVIVTKLEPYKTELGFVGQPTPGQDKVAQVTKMLNRIIPEVDSIEPSLKKARLEVEKVDVGKYPENFRGKRVKNLMEAARNAIIGAHLAVSEHRDVLEIAPSALGQPDAKTYLLLFQNDKELRATGGFITAFAQLRLDRGHLSTTASDDIYRLDEELIRICQGKVCPALSPPAPIVKYLPEADGRRRGTWSMRDSNLSPDLPTSVAEFERMYQLLDKGLGFDGIIFIDSQVVEELIAITGPIKVFDTEYSAEIDKRCNCPNVIYELEHYAEIASKGESDRKAVLGTLMQSLLSHILSSSPDKMLDFVNVGVKLSGDKHIMFYMHDSKTQQAFSQLKWTGEIQKSGYGDYLHINDSNFAGGKSNLYVEERVTLDIDPDSGIHKLTIDYKNPQGFNVWLNGILRDYVRIYMPTGASLVSSKGSDDPVTTLEDEKLNKTYFEAFVQVRPQNSRKLEFEYNSSVNAENGKFYLLIQKQPGAKDHHYTVKVKGRTKAEFTLTADKILDLSF